MGGAIALRAQAEGLRADGLILSAPLIGLGLSRAVARPVRAATRSATSAGMGPLQPLGGVSQSLFVTLPFELNVLTSDRDRYRDMGALLTARPDLGLGAPTLGWIDAAFRETSKLRRLPAPSVPVLVFMGTQEKVVSTGAIKAFAAKSDTIDLVTLEGARHEPLIETPAIEAEVWRGIDGFLARTAPSP